MPTIIDPDGEQVTVIPYVDPARNSRPFSDFDDDRSVSLVDGRPISYADIVATQPWAGAAVDWFIWKSVLVPFKLYRRTDDGERERVRPGDHPLADAINRPWRGGSSVALAQHFLGPLLVHGNGLTGVEEGARGKIEFRPADWRSIVPVREDKADPRSRVIGWLERTALGEDRPMPFDSTIHLGWWSPLGQLGISPLRKLGTTVRLDMAAQEWTGGLLGRSVRPSGVVTLDERFTGLDPDERQAIMDTTARRFSGRYAGAHRAGIPPILPPGVNWNDAKPTTAVEASLIDQRKVDREEFAAVFQIPPPMLGILDKATYSNISTLRQVAYTDGLAPPLVMIEAAFNAVVCDGLLREPDLFGEFDFAGVLRGDRLREIQAIREAISTAVLTPNEGRDLQNRPRSENPAADELYLPANNLKPLGSKK